MKENGRMWLPVPNGMTATLASAGMATRSGGGGPGNVECVVPDPDFCVE